MLRVEVKAKVKVEVKVEVKRWKPEPGTFPRHLLRLGYGAQRRLRLAKTGTLNLEPGIKNYGK